MRFIGVRAKSEQRPAPTDPLGLSHRQTVRPSGRDTWGFFLGACMHVHSLNSMNKKPPNKTMTELKSLLLVKK